MTPSDESVELNAKSLNTLISTPPQLLADWAGQSSCCIYSPPPSFLEAHTSSYLPEIISIGPFHRGNDSFKMIEEHKQKYLKALLERENISIEVLLSIMIPQVARVREYYSEDFTNVDDNTFVQMLILDGCFILELFRRAAGVVGHKDDPILSIFYIFQTILKDLIKMENQVPWFILHSLFVATDHTNGNPSLSSMALSTFNVALQRSNELIQMLQNLPMSEPTHILDFLRQSLITNNPASNGISNDKRLEIDYGGEPTSNVIQPNVIQSISQLRKVGIKVKPVQRSSFLDVNFNHGTLEMSPLMIDNFVSCLLFNGVAFEQCHATSTKHFSSYVNLLDCLVNTRRDVKYLTDDKIIQKYSGTEDEVAKLLNNMGKGLMINVETCYLSGLFKSVNLYQQKKWHTQRAKLYNKYFDSTWSIISVGAASVLLCLTILQTTFTILGYTNRF